MSHSIKTAFISFFISFTILFPTGVLFAVYFINSNKDDVIQTEMKPEFIVPKEHDMNILLTVCKKNSISADVYVIINISAHDNSVSILSLPPDITTVVNTKHGSLKELYDWGSIDCVKQAVENLMFITIDRTIKADDNAVICIVDKLGGVEMELNKDVQYENISLSSGRQFLDGARFCGALRSDPSSAVLAIGSKFTTITDISSVFSYIANLCSTNISAYDIELRKNGWKQMISQKNTDIILPQVEFETVDKYQKLTQKSKDECMKVFFKD